MSTAAIVQGRGGGGLLLSEAAVDVEPEGQRGVAGKPYEQLIDGIAELLASNFLSAEAECPDA